MSVDVGVVAFTASRDLPAGSRRLILSVLRGIAARTYVTGACIGGDQVIATLVAEHWPHRRQHIIVPRDMSRVNAVWLATFRDRYPDVRVSHMPRGTTYRDRNLALLGNDYPGVAAVRPELVIGFPLHGEQHPDSSRSGTWMTLRLARDRHIRLQPYVLSADPEGRSLEEASQPA